MAYPSRGHFRGRGRGGFRGRGYSDHLQNEPYENFEQPSTSRPSPQRNRDKRRAETYREKKNVEGKALITKVY